MQEKEKLREALDRLPGERRVRSIGPAPERDLHLLPGVQRTPRSDSPLSVTRRNRSSSARNSQTLALLVKSRVTALSTRPTGFACADWFVVMSPSSLPGWDGMTLATSRPRQYWLTVSLTKHHVHRGATRRRDRRRPVRSFRPRREAHRCGAPLSTVVEVRLNQVALTMRITGAALLVLATACSAAQSSPLDPAPSLPAHLLALGAKLGEDAGIVFADTPLASVPMHLTRDDSQERRHGEPSVLLRDGQRVVYLDHDAAADSGVGQVSALIKVGGRSGLVPNANVMTSNTLSRSIDGALAVFAPISACGDACYYALWALSARGRMLIAPQLAEMPVLLPRPRANRYIVGSDALFFVSADLTFKRYEEFHSPALAPDGTLFVRGSERDAIFRFDAADRPQLFFDLETARDPREDGEYVAPRDSSVTFENEGATVVAEFTRRHRKMIVRLNRSGKVLSKRRAKPQ